MGVEPSPLDLRIHTLCLRTLLGISACLLSACGGSYGGGGATRATLTINIAPMAISVGQSATITWNSNGASCTASGDWTGAKAGSGSEMVSPAAPGSYTYSMTCSGGGYGESTQVSVTLTVNTRRAAGLWNGEACCIDASTFRVSGVTNDAGDFRFMLLDTHFVGKAGEAPAAYATNRAGLAGQRKADAPVFALLDITPRVAVREWVRTHGPDGHAVDFSIPYESSFERASSVADLHGSYTSHLGTGYTLTITIDSTGQVIGNDTNGCRLDGRASARSAAVNAYDLLLGVSACGSSDGRYAGEAALIGDGTGNVSTLFLSTSNAESAIGWQLGR